MARVLAAESAARESVAQSRLEAQRMAELSRAAVRALTERTERRMRYLRAAFERATEAELAALKAQADALDEAHAPAVEHHPSIQAAVASAAAQLTGGPP